MFLIMCYMYFVEYTNKKKSDALGIIERDKISKSLSLKYIYACNGNKIEK